MRVGIGCSDKPVGTAPGHGEDKDERVFLDRLRPETADDIAKRAHEAALRAWRDCRPPTEVARVELDSRWGSSDEVGASASAKTPAEMRQAADDLRALADWFEAKPSERSGR